MVPIAAEPGKPAGMVMPYDECDAGGNPWHTPHAADVSAAGSTAVFQAKVGLVPAKSPFGIPSP